MIADFKPDINSKSVTKPLKLKMNDGTKEVAATSKKGKLKNHRRTANDFQQQWIAEAAYYKAQARGFMPGLETADWLAAEQDFKKMCVALFLRECKEDGDMTLTGLRRLAKTLGVFRPERIDSKVKLIHLIQNVTQQETCYQEKPSECCMQQTDCDWSGECQKLVAEWSR